jgi:hypothetical protein
MTTSMITKKAAGMITRTTTITRTAVTITPTTTLIAAMTMGTSTKAAADMITDMLIPMTTGIPTLTITATAFLKKAPGPVASPPYSC